ncbi:rhs family carbohydrate-binding protein [Asticcacaulis biprosthecium C19]|uniref:Rhs family carbohydrate-binding protein n=2 Tax=Asticcacaulis biprosthecium TaxID=76891 RepID=F4QI05_9CAUL|nr:rhs family carbohydrate-binding protein [Asticcacaulis biprosthecium C19]
MYAYVHGDPVNATDPTGLCSAPGADCGVVDMPGEIVIRGRRGGKEDWEASNTAFANMYHPGRPSDDFYRQRDEFAAFRLYTDDTITRPGLVMYLEAITAPSDVIGAKAAVKVGLKFLAKRFSAKQAARRGATTCPACFVAGTQVATPTGLVAIEKIEVGDLVLAYDARTSQVLEKPVRALIRPEPKATYALILKSALGEIETFRATDDHPWFTAAHMWVETKSLKIGDMIETATGKDFTLVSIVLSGKTEQTYNLSVADVHTFMVGENHLVVHNDGHHCIPRQILKQLSSDLRRAVQGKRGDRNIVDIGRQRHIDIHRGGYNNRWTQELTKHGGPRNITEQQLRQIDAVIRSEFKLPPRGG